MVIFNDNFWYKKRSYASRPPDLPNLQYQLYTMYNELLQHINSMVPLNKEEADALIPYFSPATLDKKEFLFKEGQTCPANYFIVKGCVRLYSVDEKGVEQIILFGIDNWWITDYMSMDKGIPSVFCLQAVEQTKLLVFDKNCREEAFEKIPKLERYFRIVTQRAYGAAQQRFRYFYEQSAEERYRLFSEWFPDFVQRIPQYMLASYLGFTPEFLSKLRAKKK